MITSPQQQLLTASGCEVCFDDLTRQPYATDEEIDHLGYELRGLTGKGIANVEGGAK